MDYIEPALQAQIRDILTYKRDFTDKEIRTALSKLWKEYVRVCKENSRTDKIRDEVIERLQSW